MHERIPQTVSHGLRDRAMTIRIGVPVNRLGIRLHAVG